MLAWHLACVNVDDKSLYRTRVVEQPACNHTQVGCSVRTLSAISSQAPVNIVDFQSLTAETTNLVFYLLIYVHWGCDICYVSSRRTRRSDVLNKSSQSAPAKRQQLTNARSAGSTENLVIDRCPTCNVVLESYDDETISLCIVCLATFIHREPALAAPLLLDMLHAVSRYHSSTHLTCISQTEMLMWWLIC